MFLQITKEHVSFAICRLIYKLVSMQKLPMLYLQNWTRITDVKKDKKVFFTITRFLYVEWKKNQEQKSNKTTFTTCIQSNERLFLRPFFARYSFCSD